LNVSYRVGDDPKIVSENVCDVKQAVGIHDGKIVTMRQMHGDNIIDVKDKTIKEAGDADGMLTAEAGVYLGALTADCVPLLFVAPKYRIAAAVHAGWRGTLAGIAAKMVGVSKGQRGVEPGEIEVALGPAIGACCYEIKNDVTEPLIDKWDKLAEACIETRGAKSFVDLRRLNQSILERAGVPSKQIYLVGPCTACAADDFFSYRRARSETGRQISFVGWLPS
jgi:YfiH family protein